MSRTTCRQRERNDRVNPRLVHFDPKKLFTFRLTSGKLAVTVINRTSAFVFCATTIERLEWKWIG